MDSDREHAEWPPVEVGDDAGFAVDPQHPLNEIRRRQSCDSANDCPRYVVRSIDKIRQSRGLAAAVGVKNDVRREQRFQSANIAADGGVSKSFEQRVVLLFSGLEARAFGADMLFGAPQNLPAVRLALSDGCGDLRIFVIEDLAEEEDRALDRVQTLEQDEEGDRQTAGVTIFIDDERFRQPLSNVLLAPNTRRLKLIDAETSDDCYEKGFCRADVVT